MIDLKIKERLKFIKDNFQYIILIPTIFGGIWQILELAKISVSFIRFFSVSQLVADGLLILFIISILFIGYKIVTFENNKDESNVSTYSNRRNIISGISLILLSLLVFYWLCIPTLKDLLIYKKTDLPSFVLCFLVTVILLRSILEGIRRIIEAKASIIEQRLTEFSSSKGSSVIITFLAPILLGFLVISFSFVVYVLITLRNNYVFPKELENLSNIKCVFDKRNVNENDWEILYFNDQYIFTEYQVAGKSKFLIIDFETMLEDQCE